MADMMTEQDLQVCKIAMKGVSWAFGKLNPSLGKISGNLLTPLCQEKYDKDRRFNAQLDYCNSVAKQSGSDASKNVELQKALLDLADLSAINGDLATKDHFDFHYLHDATTGKWMPYKWKNIKKKASD